MNEVLDQKSLESSTAISQWIKSEVSRSAYILFLDNLPLLEQAAQLQKMGYGYRIYPDGSHHWGCISPETGEWFTISVFRIEVAS
jgi:hypothetical protein